MRLPNVEGFYPLSPLQQGMLFHTVSAASTSGMYCQQNWCTLEGRLRVETLVEAWAQVAQRHGVLRTFFVWEGLDEPVQVVQGRVEIPLEQHDWRGVRQEEHQARLDAYLEADRGRQFDLSAAPLMRLALFRLGEERHQFVWTYHHILLDGGSVHQVLREAFLLYEALCRGTACQLDPVGSYRDYVAWLRQPELSHAESYWRRYLKGFTAPTPIGDAVPRTSRRGSVSGDHVATEVLRLPAATSTALASLARRLQLTVNTLVQGAWGLLLSRYTGEEDVVFGATLSIRPENAAADALVGLCINTLPVRMQVEHNAPLTAWLKTLQVQQAATRQFGHSPLVQIQGWSDVPRGLPLFESILAFGNYQVDESWRSGGSLQVNDLSGWESSNYPLNAFAEIGPELSLGIIYARDRFSATTIGRLLAHWGTLLEGMVSNPDARLSELPMLTADERHDVSLEPTPISGGFQQDVPLGRLFESQAERAPEHTAVSFAGETTTYRELNRRANQLAHHLRTRGVGPEVLVGLYMERSLEMVVGILGILKAGGAYVPLDAAYPKDRLAFILEDTRTGVIVTQQHLAGELPEHRAEVICLDAQWERIAANSDENPASGTTTENLAYVIYTSGSTGKPKGVLVTHANVVRLFRATDPWFHFDERDVWTLFHSYAFDFSVWELWGALLYGGRLVVVPHSICRSPEAFLELLSAERVTVLNQTPSAFYQLSRAEASRVGAVPLALRLVIFGGEALELQSLKPWFERHGDEDPQLVNMYGITETTVHVTYRPLSAADLDAPSGSVIGRPIPDLSIFLLDRHLRPVPFGLRGEIFVGGAGLARGYLNRPELTAERFPSSPHHLDPGARLYRTGDLARCLPNGDLEYLGRIDHQVKIRGFRVELGEIETVLASHPAVRESIVMAREDEPGDTRLVAYVVASPAPNLPTGELRAFLADRLPEYMVPATFVALDAFPLTPNGKVDRRALPAPEGTRLALGSTYVAPQSQIERTIAEVWQNVLRVDVVGAHDNFFDLGGHSLLMATLCSKLRSALGQEISVVDLFQYPSVSALAQHLSREPDHHATAKRAQVRAEKRRAVMGTRKRA